MLGSFKNMGNIGLFKFIFAIFTFKYSINYDST